MSKIKTINRRDYAKVIRANFESINDQHIPNSSTSKLHRALHKLFVQTRVKNNKFDPTIGILTDIQSEHSFMGQIDREPVKLQLHHRTYASTYMRGVAAIDVWEHNKCNGGTFTRNVEVLVGHPHNFYLPRTKEGMELAIKFGEHMIREGYWEMPSKKSGLKTKKENYFERFRKARIGAGLATGCVKNRKHGMVRLHFSVDPKVEENLVINYGPYKRFVDIKTELERKYDIYSIRADRMSFVIFENDLDLYRGDLIEMLKKKSIGKEDCNIDYFFVIDEDYFKHMLRANSTDNAKGRTAKETSGLNNIFSTKRLIKIPEKLKNNGQMHVYSLEDLLGDYYF